MAEHPNARLIQEAAVRPTEGRRKSVANKTKQSGTQSERKKGRPPGARNKPKALIPREIANELLGIVKQTLPPELYEEMKAAVKSGKNISTLNEARILMKLMGPPVWYRLIEETKKPSPVLDVDPDLLDELGPHATEAPEFDKDLNERVKVLLNVMQFVSKLETDDSTADQTAKPVLELFARKGLTAARIDIVVGESSSILGRDVDRVGGEPTGTGTIPDQLPEGQIDLSDSQQEQTVRVLDITGSRDDTQGSDES